jgi:hypothetical protein
VAAHALAGLGLGGSGGAGKRAPAGFLGAKAAHVPDLSPRAGRRRSIPIGPKGERMGWKKWLRADIHISVDHATVLIRIYEKFGHLLDGRQEVPSPHMFDLVDLADLVGYQVVGNAHRRASFDLALGSRHAYIWHGSSEPVSRACSDQRPTGPASSRSRASVLPNLN